MTNLANDAWEALLSAHAVLMKQFAAEDIWADVSMREYDVLYTLSKCPEPVRLSELNRHVLLSQPALSRLVDRLADRGLVAVLGPDHAGVGGRLAGLRVLPGGDLLAQHRHDLLAEQVKLVEDRLEGQAGMVYQEQLALVVTEVLAEGQGLVDDLLRAADAERGQLGEILQ